MRRIAAVLLLIIVAVGISLSLVKIPFGAPKTKVGRYYIDEGIKETGCCQYSYLSGGKLSWLRYFR